MYTVFLNVFDIYLKSFTVKTCLSPYTKMPPTTAYKCNSFVDIYSLNWRLVFEVNSVVFVGADIQLNVEF